MKAAFTDELRGTHLLPMRTALEQWAVAGTDCGVHPVQPAEDIYYVGGKGGPCYMRREEWETYLKLCGAPTISMRAVCDEEDRQWDQETMRQGEAKPAADDLQRIYGALETTLGEVVDLIESLHWVIIPALIKQALTQVQDRLRLCIGAVRDLKKGGAA